MRCFRANIIRRLYDYGHVNWVRAEVSRRERKWRAEDPDIILFFPSVFCWIPPLVKLIKKKKKHQKPKPTNPRFSETGVWLNLMGLLLTQVRESAHPRVRGTSSQRHQEGRISRMWFVDRQLRKDWMIKNLTLYCLSRRGAKVIYQLQPESHFLPYSFFFFSFYIFQVRHIGR